MVEQIAYKSEMQGRDSARMPEFTAEESARIAGSGFYLFIFLLFHLVLIIYFFKRDIILPKRANCRFGFCFQNEFIVFYSLIFFHLFFKIREFF